MSQWSGHSNHGFKNWIGPVGHGSIWFDRLSRRRVGSASNWVNQRSDQQTGRASQFPLDCTVQPIFSFPSHQNDVVLMLLATKRLRFNNYKSFLFLSPAPAVANPTRRPFPQPRLPLPALHPVAAGAGSTRPACHRCWGPPPPPTAANPTHRPSPQNKLPLPAPQPRLPLPASRRQCWFCWTHWSPLTILVAVTVTFQFLFFYFNI